MVRGVSLYYYEDSLDNNITLTGLEPATFHLEGEPSLRLMYKVCYVDFSTPFTGSYSLGSFLSYFQIKIGLLFLYFRSISITRFISLPI